MRHQTTARLLVQKENKNQFCCYFKTINHRGGSYPLLFILLAEKYSNYNKENLFFPLFKCFIFKIMLTSILGNDIIEMQSKLGNGDA